MKRVISKSVVKRLEAQGAPASVRFVTTAAAARLVGVSGSTMLRACEAGKVKAFQTPGGHWRVDPASVREFFAPGAGAVRKDLAARVKVLEGAVRWALGESGEFGRFRERQPDEGAFWWRKELRVRAGLT